MADPLRIVLTGAESSGKSTLAQQLGERAHLPFALEYARLYLEDHGPDYELETLLTMSREHRAYQKECVPDDAPIGLFDTDLINYKIWAEEVFGACPAEIQEALEQEENHIYLLCAPDLPWEPDPLRENPTDRERLFQRHLAEIKALGRPYKVIRGLDDARLARAETALYQFIDAQPFR